MTGTEASQTPIEFPREKLLVGDIFAVGAGNLSRAIDYFAGWILAGFGAALALLLSNLDKLQKFIDPSAIRHAGLIFVAAVFVGILEKLMAIVITTTAQGYAQGRALGLNTEGINLSAYIGETKKGFFIPGRWLIERTIKQALKGDLAAMPRGILKSAQVQVLIGLTQVGLITWAILTIVRAL